MYDSVERSAISVTLKMLNVQRTMFLALFTLKAVRCTLIFISYVYRDGVVFFFCEPPFYGVFFFYHKAFVPPPLINDFVERILDDPLSTNRF